MKQGIFNIIKNIYGDIESFFTKLILVGPTRFNNRFFFILIYKCFTPFRLKTNITRILGPLFRKNYRKIEIDITFDCDLKCFNCGRQCRQAPSTDFMSLHQIEKFIKESIAKKTFWNKIRLTGGEPTLHPKLTEIVELLLEYKNSYSKETIIQIDTNGLNGYYKYDSYLKSNEIIVANTNRKRPEQDDFMLINRAPVDFLECKNLSSENACEIRQNCGTGLTKYGYYICATAGAIDRVFGLDIGKKEIPNENDVMIEQTKNLCKYCGFFIDKYKIPIIDKNITVSESWKVALERYSKNPPKMSDY